VLPSSQLQAITSSLRIDAAALRLKAVPTRTTEGQKRIPENACNGSILHLSQHRRPTSLATELCGETHPYLQFPSRQLAHEIFHQIFNLCADLRIQVQPDIWDGVEVQYPMAVKSVQHRGSHILSNINAVPLAIMIN
jgi:hypothetical protein